MLEELEAKQEKRTKKGHPYPWQGKEKINHARYNVQYQFIDFYYDTNI